MAYYSRVYEGQLLDLLEENGVSKEEICDHLLSWLSSDDTCAALESMCTDYDIDYEDEEDE